MSTDEYFGGVRKGRKRFSNPASVRDFVAGEFSVTNSGLTLGATELSSGVRIKADAANAEAVFIGKSDVARETGFKLSANEEVFVDIDSLKKVFVKSVGGGETLSFIAS